MSDGGSSCQSPCESERDVGSAESSEDEGDRRPVVNPATSAAVRDRHKNLLRSDFPDVDMAPGDFIRFPRQYLHPLTMCAVSKGMTCLDKFNNGLQLFSCELAFVSRGEALSQHLQQAVWLFMQLNRLPDINGCAVEVPGRTRLTRIGGNGKKGKDETITGIQEVYGQTDGGYDEIPQYEDWPETDEPVPSFAESLRTQLQSDEKTHVSTPLVKMRLGIIPVMYTRNGVQERDIFMVLRVVPAEGLDLLKLIETKYLSRKPAVNDKVGCEAVKNWCTVWQKVLDYESGQNLRFQGHSSLPEVFDVRTLTGAGGFLHYLSPFLVFEKVINGCGGGYSGKRVVSDSGRIDSGTIVIGGYPLIREGNDWVGFFKNMRDRCSSYRYMMAEWRKAHAEIYAGDEAVVLPPVLRVGKDGVFCAVEMSVKQRFTDQVSDKVENMMRPSFPKLVIACSGAFMSMLGGRPDADARGQAGASDSTAEYIETYVMHDKGLVTHKALADRYEGDLNAAAEMPHANRLSGSRKAWEVTASLMIKTGRIADCVDSYYKFMTMSLIFHERETSMGVYNSMRVLTQLRILKALEKSDIPMKISKAFEFVSGQMSDGRRDVEQAVVHMEEMMAFYDIMSAVLVYNQSIRLNSINLSTYFALWVSDVFTFLGSHHNWIFKQFTVWTIGGVGHLRSKGRLYCLKRNSSGQGVVQEAFDYNLRMLAKIPDALFIDSVSFLDCHKLTRATGPQVEGLSAAYVVNGRTQTGPNETTFMRPIIVDEFNRNIPNSDAMNALINAIPRDTNGRTTAVKTADPRNGEPLRGRVDCVGIVGCGPYVLAVSTNANPKDGEHDEQLKSLAVVVCAVSPGAPSVDADIDVLSEERNTGKRLNSGHANMNEGQSNQPTDPDVVYNLAYVLSVLPAVCRNIGLVDKSGVLNFDLSPMSMLLCDWLMFFLTSKMGFLFGSTQSADMNRIMQGYLSRGVGLSLILTVAKHMKRQQVNYRDVCINAIVEMESSAMSVQTTHTALLSGITRFIDVNVIWTSQIVGRIVKAPVLDLDWLLDLFDVRKPVVQSNGSHAALMEYLKSLAVIKGDYIPVPNLADSVMYGRMMTYLEMYCSVKKESYDTYLSMIEESSRKEIILSDVLGLENVALSSVLRRMGIPFVDSVNPDGGRSARNSFLYLDKDARGAIRGSYVHVLAHLWMLALQGHHGLHAENSDEFAANLYTYVVRRFLPVQMVPAGVVFANTFKGYSSEPRVLTNINRSYIVPGVGTTNMVILDSPGPSYILRPVVDIAAFENGRISFAGSFFPPYPPEDTAHMSSKYGMFMNVTGNAPESPFDGIYGVRPRTDELYATRVYPAIKMLEKPVTDEVTGKVSDREYGVVCVYPNGFNFVLLMFGEERRMAVEADVWCQLLYENYISTGPLIHRHNAIVELSGDRGLGVILPREEEDAFESINFSECDGWEEGFGTARVPAQKRFYMDVNGLYRVLRPLGEEILVHYLDFTPLELGRRIYVSVEGVKDALRSFEGGGYTLNLRDIDITYVRGWLRYPDECSNDPVEYGRAYVVFKVVSGGVKIVGVDLSHCQLALPAWERVQEQI